MCACACVCLCVLFVQGVSFDISCGQVHGTWEHNHNDQVIIRVYKCTGVSTGVKQIIFEECIKIVVVECCMYYEINGIFVKYKCRANAAGKLIQWRSYYKSQFTAADMRFVMGET